METNLAGKPVIAGRVGGVTDAVVDGETGLLVDPYDIDDIARAMESLLSDDKLRLRLGEQGRRRAVEQFSRETVARRLETLMLSSLQSADVTQERLK